MAIKLKLSTLLLFPLLSFVHDPFHICFFLNFSQSWKALRLHVKTFLYFYFFLSWRLILTPLLIFLNRITFSYFSSLLLLSNVMNVPPLFKSFLSWKRDTLFSNPFSIFIYFSHETVFPSFQIFFTYYFFLSWKRSPSFRILSLFLLLSYMKSVRLFSNPFSPIIFHLMKMPLPLFKYFLYFYLSFFQKKKSSYFQIFYYFYYFFRENLLNANVFFTFFFFLTYPASVFKSFLYFNFFSSWNLSYPLAVLFPTSYYFSWNLFFFFSVFAIAFFSP